MRIATFIDGSWTLPDTVWTAVVNFFLPDNQRAPQATYDMVHARLRRSGLYITYQYELRFYNPNNVYADRGSIEEEALWEEAISMLYTLHRMKWIRYETPFMIVYRPWNRCLYRFESHLPRLKIDVSSLDQQQWLPNHRSTP